MYKMGEIVRNINSQHCHICAVPVLVLCNLEYYIDEKLGCRQQIQLYNDTGRVNPLQFRRSQTVYMDTHIRRNLQGSNPSWHRYDES